MDSLVTDRVPVPLNDKTKGDIQNIKYKSRYSVKLQSKHIPHSHPKIEIYLSVNRVVLKNFLIRKKVTSQTLGNSF